MTVQPFTTLSGNAAPLPEENIDTDIIFPARFLLITARDGLGPYAFHDRRMTADGQENPDFVLNKAPWRNAPIIVAGANFGSGSSREQAVWALLGYGVRTVIAPSFGEIFHANCFRNGVLPITLSAEQISPFMDAAQAGKPFTIDLDKQIISAEGCTPLHFPISEERKLALLNGWDETALLLNNHAADIDAFEYKQAAVQTWLY